MTGRLWIMATLALAVALPAHAADRPQVAVLDFDYGTLDRWWGSYDIGKGIADQVVDGLVNDGSFRVIERKKLDAILAEQNFAASDRADPDAAKLASMGKVLGVRYFVTGSITKYSNEKGGGGVRVKGIGLGGSKAKSEVQLTARVIDTTTGEIKIGAKGKGESKKGGGLSFSSSDFGAGFGSDEWRQSALGDAQEQACEDLVENLAKRADKLN